MADLTQLSFNLCDGGLHFLKGLFHILPLLPLCDWFWHFWNLFQNHLHGLLLQLQLQQAIIQRFSLAFLVYGLLITVLFVTTLRVVLWIRQELRLLADILEETLSQLVLVRRLTSLAWFLLLNSSLQNLLLLGGLQELPLQGFDCLEGLFVLYLELGGWRWCGICLLQGF